jgi:hypothetical protein
MRPTVKPEELKVGQCFDMPSGVSRRIVGLAERSSGQIDVQLEKLNGKCPGVRAWKSADWFCNYSGAELRRQNRELRPAMLNTKEHQIAEGFAVLRTGADFSSASELSGIPPEELQRLWAARQPAAPNEINPLAHEQMK